MPPYDPCNLNFWDNQRRDSVVTIDTFLPNGLIVTLKVPADTTVAEFKSKLWVEASNLQLFYLLKAANCYVLLCVSRKGGTEELVDESRTIFDVQPFKPYFKVVEKRGDNVEKLLNSKISMLIGKSLTEFDNMEKEEEIRDFRRVYRDTCEHVATLRRRSSWGIRAMYSYPPQLAASSELPDYLCRGVKSELIVNVAVARSIAHTFHIPLDFTTEELITLALKKKASTLQLKRVENQNDFILKIAGRKSFLFYAVTGNESAPKLTSFKYIQECIGNGVRPQIVLVQKSDLDVEARITAGIPAPPLPPKPERSTISLWDIGPDSMVKIKIVCATNINAPGMQVAVKCGIYLGGDSLCDIMCTSSQPANILKWNEFVEFGLPVCNIPRMARLCFCIYGFIINRKDTQVKRGPVPLSWANITMFDYKGFLRTGPHKLYVWPCHNNECTETPLNPLGTTVANSNQENGPCLLIDFTKFAEPVNYPTDEKIFELAAATLSSGHGPNPLNTRGSKHHKDVIEEIIARDPLLPIFEQDKELLWFLRAECRESYPESLPKLLQSMKWNRREDVAQMYALLQSWRKDHLRHEHALELLDYTYADARVRKFAVELIDNWSDNEVEEYLLQLVQVLKYEAFLDCSLARFLLQRALNNRRLGHFLFWYLRSEMHNPQVAVRYGLILEAYFRGSPGHLESLTKQYEAINKLKTVTELLKSSDKRAEEKLKLMRECLAKLNEQGAFRNLEYPLEPSLEIDGLKVDKCKYLTSAKKPLWLVFENRDEFGEPIMVIFKNGDDLRQDLLTLQMLRIMDSIWKEDGLDFQLEPYRCMPTGNMTGLIEIVSEAETVARIQTGFGITKGVTRDDALYNWLKNKDNDPQRFLQVTDKFKRSCIGYCVATYVLGIGDRHNDNVMMRINGQMFHIDFGHFLGNFKKKFGIRRERVPFVLTSDFLYIICDGSFNRRNQDVEDFQNQCLNAFMKLRSHGNLFITLFAMMLYTGIPELQKPDDLEYIRNSLALTKSAEESKKHFEEIFTQAYQKRVFASLNFLIHNLKHHWMG